MNLTLKDFAKIFGFNTKDISARVKTLFYSYDFRYNILTDEKFRNIVLDSIKKLELNDFTVAGEKKLVIWENGWKENLNNFIKSGYNLDEIMPKFYKHGVLKLFNNYIETINPNFEYNLSYVMALCLFEKYFKDFDNIYEFGCGTSQNLVLLRKYFPEKNLYGTDWANHSIKLTMEINKHYNTNINIKKFDMFHPDYKFNFNKSSLMFTIGAMEQLGAKYKPFLKFLLDKKPSLCITLEPIYELYDENNLLDYLAMKFHTQKNLLSGYLTELKQLDKDGIIKILKIHRVGVGSLFNIGWNIIVWRVN